ncbi:MAG: bifunctional phosphoribosylaminoimidazolecarboxamide formyltransferase/IMP cyclohydrolase [Spirochaetaceae bacterium]|nr:bifunctional phosphoribosylaminoimidazolecarboxamide formyltransferase/IMP cyclohydrolase [Spirochaetaceae bacterium]
MAKRVAKPAPKRALISVYDKNKIIELAAALKSKNWDIIATCGTAKHLRESEYKFEIISVEKITKYLEHLDGRVKTLHPAIHTGILARRNEKSHNDALKKFKIPTIDLVAVNLYPFTQKAAQNPPLTQDELIDFIDIGGPAMLRSAAKNHNDVIVLCDPDDYDTIIQNIQADKPISPELRRQLAAKTFNLTSAYDAAISQCLMNANTDTGADNAGETETKFPPYYTVPLKLENPLRYGENPQQKAALYINTGKQGAIAKMEQLNGKELSYNNYRDIDIAWKAVCSFGLPEQGLPALGADNTAKLLNFTEDNTLNACVAVKHNTPCGAALGKTLREAFEKTYSCDTESIFGGIAAFNATLDTETAEKISPIFLEVVIAPDYEETALEILRKKTKLRVMRAVSPPVERLESVSIDGALLVQEVNKTLFTKWETVTKTAVDERHIPDILFGLRTALWVKSNAIVIVKDQSAIGIGGGQTSRILAAQQALRQAGMNPNKPARVLVSDAFFPFPDIVEAAAAAGIKTIVQSGGSNKDVDSIEMCDKHGITMIFTGARYFKH